MYPTVVSALNRVRDLRDEVHQLRVEGRHFEAAQVEARIEALMSDIARISTL